MGRNATETRVGTRPRKPKAPPSANTARDGGAAEAAPRLSDKESAVYRKEIIYDRETRDYAMYLDGNLVGFARNYQEAETTLDNLVFDLLNGR